MYLPETDWAYLKRTAEEKSRSVSYLIRRMVAARRRKDEATQEQAHA